MSDTAPVKSMQQLIEEGVAARHHPAIPPIERAAGKLRQVVKWHGEFPVTDRNTANGMVLSFGAAFGSNGEREFMRALVSSALLDLDEAEKAKDAPSPQLTAADLERFGYSVHERRSHAPGGTSWTFAPGNPDNRMWQHKGDAEREALTALKEEAARALFIVREMRDPARG